MTRGARISYDLQDAWEVWDISYPDDAPSPVTVEWLLENMGSWDFEKLKDSGFRSMVNLEIEEDYGPENGRV